MNLFYLLPVFLGITVVIQGNLNRQIGSLWGLPTAVLINAAVFFLCSFAFYLHSRAFPESWPEFLRVRPGFSEWSWWYLIPGLCGFSLVLGLPWAFQNIGSAKSFILLVTAQVMMGLLWDAFVSKLAVSPLTLAGAGLTLAGAVLTILSR